MSDYNPLYQHGLYLSPDQQDLLLAALSSNNPSGQSQHKQQDSNPQPKTESDGTPARASTGSFSVSPSGGFDNHQLDSYDESPFLDFNPELDFDFPDSEHLIGDIPDYEPGDKRKDIDGTENENEESGKKRRESDDKTAKKPGRKPLTSEPTSKRKAQNRAAQRAFRDRKEKHLKDLETQVDELQKSSDDANQENGLLRAQVERLQVELREYRKRLSWLTSGNGVSAMNAIPGAAYSRGMYGLKNNEFLFDFPKFGDLPGAHLFNNSQPGKTNPDRAKENQSVSGRNDVPGVVSRDKQNNTANGQYSSPASARSASGVSAGNSPRNAQRNGQPSSLNPAYHAKKSVSSMNDTSNSDSPSSSSDSHQSQFLSSSGTSPEPSLNSPATGKPSDNFHHHHVHDAQDFCAQLGLACGNIKNPIPVVRHNSESASNTPVMETKPSQPPQQPQQPQPPVAGLDNLAQENGGQFDPVLFGDWREPQDAVLSQDFGTFFDDAFPLPDLGSPSHNLSEAAIQQPPKKDLISQIDRKLDEDDEVVPGEDKAQMLSCTKIWDRLQSMERFRNGEIDVDNLCSELRTKARCSETGVVVDQKDVDDIMGRARPT